MTIPFVEAKGLSKWYGQVVGLNDVTVTVGPGVTGLLGPNGAGKSTFLRLVAGQLEPSRGTIRVLGERPFGSARLPVLLGLCPDTDAFFEEMTGLEFVAAMLKLSGLPKADARRRAAAAIERAGLDPRLRKRIAAYSKGMRQRLKLSQALAHEPVALLLDEPLNGLDPVGRAALISLIHDCGKRGTSVLVSSHILHEVEAMTDQILLVHQGRLLAEGRIREIRDLLDRHPHHVRIDCSEPRRLASALVSHGDVVRLALEPDGSTLVVETVKPDDFYRRLPPLLRSERISLRSLESTDEGLAAVFRYLVTS